MNAPALLRTSQQRNAELVLDAAIAALVTSTGIAGQRCAFEPGNEPASRADAQLELLVDGRSYRYLVEMARALGTRSDPEGYAAKLLAQFKAGFGAQ